MCLSYNLKYANWFPCLRICMRWPVCYSICTEMCIGMCLMIFGLAARCVFWARMPIYYYFCFGSSGCGMYRLFRFPWVLPAIIARFHFIATYLCGICLLSLCWNTIVTARLVLWTTGWGLHYLYADILGGSKFRLMLVCVGFVLRGGGFVGIRIDLYFDM